MQIISPDDEEKRKVMEAMQFFESKTCVKFTERTNEQKYIIINKEEPGCFAYVGYQTACDVMPVNLHNPGCMDPATIQHEFVHVLGLYHEHSRSDRDEYVDIFLDNVEHGKLTLSEAVNCWLITKNKMKKLTPYIFSFDYTKT